ncbi:hypothetical protein XENTR_v10013910 [Xenopus tropicalis]|nr:hypothetical protein XENTR_v10013910 [Xenopus tropicalis]
MRLIRYCDAATCVLSACPIVTPCTPPRAPIKHQVSTSCPHGRAHVNRLCVRACSAGARGGGVCAARHRTCQ